MWHYLGGLCNLALILYKIMVKYSLGVSDVLDFGLLNIAGLLTVTDLQNLNECISAYDTMTSKSKLFSWK